jgi:N-carbamoylputrescine amidase
LWDGKYHPIRSKYYLPNERGFYEAVWFNRGRKDFRVFEWNDIRIGILICSEIFFNEWARYYGRLDAHIIAVPRATTVTSVVGLLD